MNTPLKHCHKCGNDYPETSEHWQKQRGRFSSPCRICRRKIARDWNVNEQSEQQHAVGDLVSCTQCGEIKVWNARNFLKEKRKGIHQPCRSCKQTQQRQHKREKYHADPEWRKERYQYQQTWRDNNRDHVRQYAREYSRNNYWRNGNRHCAATRKWQIHHTEQRREYRREYNRQHPEKTKAMQIRRQARKLKLPDTFTAQEWTQCFEWWDGRCAYCGNQQGLFIYTKLTADHFIPLTSPNCPGTIARNIIPACYSCNSSKSSSDPAEWAIRKFGKRKAKAILERIQTYFKSLGE